MRRRWAVVLPVVLIGLVAFVGIYATTKPLYHASGAVLLIAPATPQLDATADYTSVNPYLSLGGLTVVQNVLVRVLDADPTVRALVAQGVQPGYSVKSDASDTQGPILDITAQGTSPSITTRSVGLVMAEVGRQLDAWQSQQNVQRRYFITSSIVVGPGQAQLVTGRRSRRLAVVALADIAAAVGIAILADWRANRRARRKAAAAERRGADAGAARSEASNGTSTYTSVG